MQYKYFCHFKFLVCFFVSISIRTDTSDDDDFEMVFDENEAPAFNHSHMSETSSTADTDDLSSVFAESTSASRAKEVVC